MCPRSGSNPVKSELDYSLQELARLLIDAGVSLPSFQSQVETAFIRAAAAKAKFANQKLNQSTIAAMTGLNRLRIRTAVKAEKKALRETDRIRRIILKWKEGSTYQTSRGTPRILPLKGGKSSFESLAQQEGGDIPARALLREMQRLGLVEVTARSVRLKGNQRLAAKARGLARLDTELASALSTPQSGSIGEIDAQSHQLLFQSLTRKGRMALRQRIAQNMTAFEADLQSAIDAVSTFKDNVKDKNHKMSKLAVLLITHE